MLDEARQAVTAELAEMYRSAILSGDIESATMCRLAYPVGGFWSGALSLSSVSQNLVGCLKEAVSRGVCVFFIYFPPPPWLLTCTFL